MLELMTLKSFKYHFIWILFFPLILSFLYGCSSSTYILNSKDITLVDSFVDKLSSQAAGIDSIQKNIVKDGLIDVGKYLTEKDADSFKELNKKIANLKDASLLISKIYDTNFLKLASEFYKWSNKQETNKITATSDSIFNYKQCTTPHFLIYYYQDLDKKNLKYISTESERIFNKLLKQFKPDQDCLNNFKKLALYKAWETGQFDINSGTAELTNGKIVLVITQTQRQMLNINGNSEEGIGGNTNFGYTPSKPDSIPVWITCQVALNYSGPLSLVPLTHEITHAFTMTAYSRPQIVDSLLENSKYKIIDSLSVEQLRQTIIKNDGLIAEGIAYWENYSIGTFADVHFLPTVNQLIKQDNIELPKLDYLVNGEISISFWDMIRGIFGYVPEDKITNYILSSASFMGFVLNHSTPEQLRMVFSGSSEELKPADLEKIYNQPISQIESEWKHYDSVQKYN